MRSDFIVGFPGETEADLAELERFLTGARLDAIGVFGYSDEDRAEAATYENKLDQDVVNSASRACPARRGAGRAAPSASVRPSMCSSSRSAPSTGRSGGRSAVPRTRRPRPTVRCSSRAAKV